MKRLVINAKVLSPLHFASDITLTPLDFVILDGMYHRIDFKELSTQDNDLFTAIIEEIDKNRFKEAHRLLADNFDKAFSQYSGIVGESVQNAYHKSGFSPDEKFLISSIIRSDAPGFSAILPGSSIKGVIRTAFLSTEFDKLDDELKSKIVKFKGAPPGGISRFLWQEGMILDAMYRLPGKSKKAVFDKFNDPFEDFAVEDVLLDKRQLEIAEIKNATLDKSGRLNWGYGHFLEAIPSELSANPRDIEFRIICRINKKSPIQGWTELKSLLDEYFLIELRREVNQLSPTSRYYWKDIAEALMIAHNKIDDQSALIRMGRYCGSNFTTIRQLLKRQPSSRNLYDNGTPMGFVRLEINEETEI